MGITFTSALLLFTGLFTLLFATLLILTHDRKGHELSMSHYKANILLTIADAVAVVTLFLNLATPIRANDPLLYEAAIIAIAALTIIPVITSKSTSSITSKALIAIILLNIILLFDQLPSTGIVAGEGAEMYRDMYVTRHWNFSFAHNPAYNPFPAQVAQLVMMEKVLNLTWYSSLAGSIWYGIFIAIYDVIIYLLTLRLTGNRRASVLASFFIGVTPETALTLNPHLWLSNLFVIISTIGLINVIEGNNPVQNAVISVISYVLAMLSLTTALLMLFVPISFIIAWYILTALKLYKPTYQESTSLRKKLITSLFLTYTVITLLIILYTEGYFPYIYPMITNTVEAIWQLINSPFTRSITSSSGETYHFLYNSTNPVLAYAWSLAISIAASYLLYIILRKRRENIWLMTLLIIGLSIPIIAALQRLFTTTYPMTANAYTAVPLIFPIAGLALSQLRDKGRVIPLLLIPLLIAVVPIASYDPSISPIAYAEVHHYNVPPMTISEYEDSLILNDLLPNSMESIYVYSPIMGTTSWYSPSLGWIGEYPTNVIVGAISTIRFIYNESSINIYIVVYNNTLDKPYYVTLGPGAPPIVIYNPLNNPDILFSSNYAILFEPS